MREVIETLRDQNIAYHDIADFLGGLKRGNIRANQLRPQIRTVGNETLIGFLSEKVEDCDFGNQNAKKNLVNDVKKLIRSISKPSDSDIRSIIEDESKSKETVIWARKVGGLLAMEGATTTQIRNIYGTVKRLDMKLAASDWNDSIQAQLYLLKPRLAYASKRDNKLDLLERCLALAIDTVTETSSDNEKKKRYKRMSAFFEAIVAYFKAAGGK